MIALATLQQRVSSLLDRFDQPAGRLDPLLNELSGRRIGLLCCEAASDSSARWLVGVCSRSASRTLVHALVVGFDDQVGNDIMGVVDFERRPRPQVEPAEVFEGFLDLLERNARFLLDGRQPVMLEIVEMLGDQDLQHIVARNFGR